MTKWKRSQSNLLLVFSFGMLSHGCHRVAEVGRALWSLSGPATSSRRVTCSRLIRAMSSQHFNISKDGDSTTSLGGLFQCPTILTVKKCCFVFRPNFLFSNLYQLPLLLALRITEKTHLHSIPSNIYRHS